MAGVIAAFMVPIGTFFALIFASVGLLLPAPFNNVCFVLAALGAFVAISNWMALRERDKRDQRREAETKARFAAAHPELFSALVELEALSARVPGYKVIRFSAPSMGGNQGKSDIVVWGVADVWSEEEPVSVEGLPVAQWRANFPEKLGDFTVSTAFARHPISLMWAGGVDTGVYRLASGRKKNR